MDLFCEFPKPGAVLLPKLETWVFVVPKPPDDPNAEVFASDEPKIAVVGVWFEPNDELLLPKTDEVVGVPNPAADVFVLPKPDLVTGVLPNPEAEV